MSCKRTEADGAHAQVGTRGRVGRRCAPHAQVGGRCGARGAGRARGRGVPSKLAAAVAAAALAASLGGCAEAGSAASGTSVASETASATIAGEIAAVALDTADLFSDADLDDSYDAVSAETIELADGGSTSTAAAVSVEGDIVTVTGAGTYVVSGTLSNGSLVVDADDDDVHLVLDGVTISSETSAALLVRSAGNVYVTLAAGTDNTLSTTGSYDDSDEDGVDAAVFAKDDLTLNGSGSLTAFSAEGHGILSKDDLAITGGTYRVEAAKRALSGNDSVRILDGTFDLVSGTDAIHAENTDDETRGYVCIEGGEFSITSAGDGISASSTTQIDGGTFLIVTGDGAGEVASASSAQGEASPTGTFGSAGETDNAQSTDADADSETSQKAVKADGDVVIRGGTLSVDAADDAIHANGNVWVADGSFELSTGDDAIHADGQTAISGGDIVVPQSVEGVEGQTVLITGGTTDIVSSDDGLNAASSSDDVVGAASVTADSSCVIAITGGEITIDAGGDGIDSNGSILVTGGSTVVYGPESGEDGAIDYEIDATIDGGTVIAFGQAAMAQGFGSESTQASALVTVSASAGSTVVLEDASGAELLSATAAKAATSVVVSCPDMEADGTYALVIDGSRTEFSLDGVTYGTGNGMPGGAGLDGSMGGMDPGGDMPSGEPNGGEAPSSEAPGGEMSGSETPGSEAPGGAESQDGLPEDGAPSGDAPGDPPDSGDQAT